MAPQRQPRGKLKDHHDCQWVILCCIVINCVSVYKINVLQLSLLLKIPMVKHLAHCAMPVELRTLSTNLSLMRYLVVYQLLAWPYIYVHVTRILRISFILLTHGCHLVTLGSKCEADSRTPNWDQTPQVHHLIWKYWSRETHTCTVLMFTSYIIMYYSLRKSHSLLLHTNCTYVTIAFNTNFKHCCQ